MGLSEDDSTCRAGRSTTSARSVYAAACGMPPGRRYGAEQQARTRLSGANVRASQRSVVAALRSITNARQEQLSAGLTAGATRPPPAGCGRAQALRQARPHRPALTATPPATMRQEVQDGRLDPTPSARCASPAIASAAAVLPSVSTAEADSRALARGLEPRDRIGLTIAKTVSSHPSTSIRIGMPPALQQRWLYLRTGLIDARSSWGCWLRFGG